MPLLDCHLCSVQCQCPLANSRNYFTQTNIVTCWRWLKACTHYMVQVRVPAESDDDINGRETKQHSTQHLNQNSSLRSYILEISRDIVCLQGTIPPNWHTSHTALAKIVLVSIVRHDPSMKAQSRHTWSLCARVHISFSVVVCHLSLLDSRFHLFSLFRSQGSL